MPLRDVVESGGLTVLGRVRLGWQEPNASGRGEHAVQADHFVFKDTPVLAELFGDECKTLKVKFPFPSFDKNIAASYRVWAGGRRKGSGICLCEGDGEKVISSLPFTVSYNQKGSASVKRAAGDRLVSYGKAAVDIAWGTHEFQVGDVVPCPGRQRNLYPHCEVCRPNILLNIEIQHPELNVFGYWQVGTGSLANYRHFLAVWDKLTLKPDGTRIPIPMNDVPFELSVRPGTTLFQDDSKNWAVTEKLYLHLQLDSIVVKLLRDYRAQRFVSLLQGHDIDLPQLSAPDPEANASDGPDWEEGVFEDAAPESEPEPSPHKFEPEQINAVVKKKLAESANANAMLNLSNILTPEDSVGRIVAWAALYRAQRDQDVEPADAAKAADKMLGEKKE